MDYEFHTREKYRKILTDTTREMNRVLSDWADSGKSLDYIQCNSLFRSYFSRFCKTYIDYSFYSKLVRLGNPVCSVLGNKLKSIYINVDNSYGSLNIFMEELQKFDYSSISEKDKSDKLPNFSTHFIPINFNNIQQIKFK